MKKLGVIVAAVALAAVSIVGVVSAQQGQQPPPPATQEAGQGQFNPQLGQPGQPPPPGAGGIMRQLLQIVATDLDLQPQALLQQLRGQSLADIIKANNGDMTKITADITKAVTDQVNQAVTNGRLSQDSANQILSNLPTAIQNALQGTGRLNALRGRLGLGGRQGQGGVGPLALRPGFLTNDVRPLLSAVESATKLTPQQIAQALRGGQTLSQIITANGADPATVESSAITTVTQRLDQMRQNGNLTQDQENTIVSGLKAFYDAVLNATAHQPQPQQTPQVGSGSI